MATITADSVTPSSGSGYGPQTFQVAATSSAGAANITQVWLVIQDPFVPLKPQIVLQYRHVTGDVWLYKADETGYWTGSAGSTGTLTNGIVTVNLAACSVSFSGNTITATFSLTFAAGAWGKRTLWVNAENGTDQSGYQNLGSWTVPGAPSEALRVIDTITAVRTPIESGLLTETVKVAEWVITAERSGTPSAQSTRVIDTVSAQMLQGSVVRVWVAGTQIVGPEAAGVEQMIAEAFQVTDLVGGAANSATIRIRRMTPVEGSAVVITLDGGRIFAGSVVRTTQVIAEHTCAVLGWDLECLSDQYLLDAKVVNARYVVESATDIVEDLVATFAPGFTATVDADLEVLDEMTITNETLSGALDRVAARAGVSWQLSSDRDIVFGDVIVPAARSVTDADRGPVQGSPTIQRDYSQVKTRVFSEGGGANLLTLVEAGDTILPVADASWYDPTGGQVSVGPERVTYTGIDEGGGGGLVGPGVSPGVAPTAAVSPGANLGTGVYQYAVTFVTALGETLPSPVASVTTGYSSAPSTAPSTTANTAGTGPDIGDHLYAVTFVTSSGETTASPNSGVVTTSSVTLGTIADPVTGVYVGTVTGGAPIAAELRYYSVTFTNGSGETRESQWSAYYITVASASVPLTIPVGPSGTTGRKIYRADPVSGYSNTNLLATISNNTATSYTDTAANGAVGSAAPTTNTTGTTTAYRTVNLTNIPTGPSAVTSRKLYRTAAGGSQLKLVATIADNTTTTYQDTTTDASLGANVPTSNTATANRVALTAIPVGPSGVTSRRLYRTTVGGSSLLRLATLSDNTTTTYTDSVPDGSLTTAVPSVDTSGLQSTDGQVAAGETSLPCASMGVFPTSGWAIIGNGQQVIRYTGRSDTALTGIPASGAGAIVAAIGYNSTVTAAPQITGLPASGAGALTQDALNGTPVNVLTQHDDGAAQAMMASRTGGDGIFEVWIRDQRFSLAETRNRGQAKLAEVTQPAVSVSYRTRDPLSKAGAFVTFSLASPVGLSETLRIQSARLTLQTLADGSVRPEWEVEASTKRYSFEQWLRRLTGSPSRTDGETAV